MKVLFPSRYTFKSYTGWLTAVIIIYFQEIHITFKQLQEPVSGEETARAGRNDLICGIMSPPCGGRVVTTDRLRGCWIEAAWLRAQHSHRSAMASLSPPLRVCRGILKELRAIQGPSYKQSLAYNYVMEQFRKNKASLPDSCASASVSSLTAGTRRLDGSARLALANSTTLLITLIFSLILRK